MNITTHLIQSIGDDKQYYPSFNRSEFYDAKKLFAKAFREAKSCYKIIDIILDQGNSRQTSKIGDFNFEEELCLRSLLGEEYTDEKKKSILFNAIQSSNIRLFFVNCADRDEYFFINSSGYNLGDDIYNDNYFISVFLFKDFPEDSYKVQYNVISSIIENVFIRCMKMNNVTIYNDITVGDILCFPSNLSSSDIKFIMYYAFYYIKALLYYIPYNSLVNKFTEEEGLSLLVDCETCLAILSLLDKEKNADISNKEYSDLLYSMYYKYYLMVAALQDTDLDNFMEHVKTITENEQN